MSSLTISMTEIDLRRSPSDASGDSKRIFGAPALRMAKNDHAPLASAASSAAS